MLNTRRSSVVKRVNTGVPGLDKLLKGGPISDRVYVVTGPPGSGKTTLGMQYLAYNAWHEEKGLFVSLMEDVGNQISDMKSFSFKCESLIDSGKLAFMDMGKILESSLELPTYNLHSDNMPPTLAKNGVISFSKRVQIYIG